MAHYNSFVVRIWSDDSGDVRGEVVHVATQERRRFLTWDRMEEFIVEHLGPASASADRETIAEGRASPPLVDWGEPDGNAEERYGA